MRVDLSRYNNADFDRGASRLVEALWIITRVLVFDWCPWKCSGLKCSLLRLFGAQVGHGVEIKPEVKITFPWKLTLGNHVWLGEECWLLNLAPITIADNVCISQRAFLCTGNHDYKSTGFDLMVSPIQIHEGVWIGAGAIVSPGVQIGSHAVLTAGSVATSPMEPFGIYRGNPAEYVKQRVLAERPRPNS